MIRPRRRRLAPALLVLVAASLSAVPAGAAPETKSPRLVVLVGVDQLRADYLERFGARLTAAGRRGFLRLAREGASWVDARHRHAPTITGPGHATIGSGTYPSVHGIVANEWWERAEGAAKGRPVYCVDDPDAVVFGAEGAAQGAKKVGPRNFRGDSLGDAMKAGLTPTPRVVGLSIKDRSAILLAGRRADACFWIDPRTDGFVTCDRFALFRGESEGAKAARVEVETTLRTFNDKRLPEFVRAWTLDPAAGKGYEEAAPDDRPPEGAGAVFPHEPRFPRDIRHAVSSPAGNDLLVAALEAFVPLGPGDEASPRTGAAASLALGAREGAVDLLCLSFSTPDLVGHRYGPDSQEAADDLMRLDGSLERLLALLDEKVGAGRFWLALTADHGVAPLPEAAVQWGLDAGRLFETDLGATAAAALAACKALIPYAPTVEAVVDQDVWLGLDAVPHELRPLARSVVRDALVAHAGVARAYTRDQLLEGRVPPDAAGSGALRSFDPARSGDVVLFARPFWVYGGPVPGTSHGQPWSYDARVPLMLMGPGVVPGPRMESAAVVDLVATLAALLHVTPPAGCEGRILSEAIDRDAWKATSPLR